MPDITEKEINEAIKHCMWRQDFMGTAICSGNCGVCCVEIESGRCDTLKRLFEKAAKEESCSE